MGHLYDKQFSKFKNVVCNVSGGPGRLETQGFPVAFLPGCPIAK